MFFFKCALKLLFVCAWTKGKITYREIKKYIESIAFKTLK